ncbi:alpha/beta fold hydrolase [Crossiella cryophila]|uniref:Pimeloyl-ACP methyl ester carboxylesterase n=1 Tax=Crossiella cryophila TaxID=43355 RepID=A0A7W7CHN8_9PSEU|nr:alpha/beta hydrolase [Crossiella cryophila]MBB4679951.1 pimeloyl-ACP methyl ester carboxylesterase [Crossiella cryophila]
MSAEPTGISRRNAIRAAGAGALLFGLSTAPTASATPSGRAPSGHGSVSQAPNLPRGFTKTFTSHYIDTGDLRQHAVIGGEGPPLLLLHGWPQTWYTWRLLMPALAKDFRVIAVDQRGCGLTGKPRTGYDTGTLAADLVALMSKLGHPRFALVGHDTGMPISYALAADHPDRVERLAVAEAIIPGLTQSPPLLGTSKANERLWHFGFNRLGGEVNERLVQGREQIYFGAKFAASAYRPLPEYAVRHYINTLARDGEALRGSFEWYRALEATIAQNERRKATRLTLPVLAIGGGESAGEGIANTMRLAADDVRSVVIPRCGHWITEEAPAEVLAALSTFLAP